MLNMTRNGVLESIKEQQVPAQEQGIWPPNSWYALVSPDSVQSFYSRPEASLSYSQASAAIMLDVTRCELCTL